MSNSTDKPIASGLTMGEAIPLLLVPYRKARRAGWSRTLFITVDGDKELREENGDCFSDATAIAANDWIVVKEKEGE